MATAKKAAPKAAVSPKKIAAPAKAKKAVVSKEAKAIAKGEIKRKCPKCTEGDIVLRSSIYGKFLGCSSYPKCRYTEKLQNS